MMFLPSISRLTLNRRDFATLFYPLLFDLRSVDGVLYHTCIPYFTLYNTLRLFIDEILIIIAHMHKNIRTIVLYVETECFILECGVWKSSCSGF